MKSKWHPPVNLAEICRTGGHGDRLLAMNHDIRKPWYMMARTKDRAYFNPGFRAVPGRIGIQPDRSVEAGLVMVEPNIKGTFSSTNKDWGFQRWQVLVERSPVPLIQCGPTGTRFLRGVDCRITPTFEHAVAVLARVRGIVTTDGGLHHAAAALRKPAVVIWGCFSDPAILGYSDHINLYRPDDEGLGQLKPHPACRAAMSAISVDQVLEAMTNAFA